jgi:hypothetical protein
MGPVFAIAALVAVLAVFGIGMVLQERGRRVDDGVVVYGVDDAVVYIWERVPEDMTGVIGRADIRRILEWEMLYLQQPSKREGPAVVGGLDAAAFVQQRAHETGHSYEPEAIFVVLDLQADYLQAIGAVGGPVEPGEGTPRV